ncbi:MAG: hypothetical protein HUK08_06735 [Bacteroidaceae bacterium]|nr:hypothetical protein [Bacteroidaceae bacterium]
MGKKVFRIKADESAVGEQKQAVVSDDAMEKLARIMNDTPTVVSLAGTEWEIRGLKPGVQWLICEKVCDIVKTEKAVCDGYEDALRLMCMNLPATCECLVLAMLNDKERIYDNFEKRAYSKEFKDTYDLLMFGDFEMRNWGQILLEVLQRIDVGFFLQSISLLKTVRQGVLQRKMTTAEAE